MEFSTYNVVGAYLVGDLPDDIFEKNIKQSRKTFRRRITLLGFSKKNGIPEDVAIEMLHLMVGLGADLKVKDYYGDTIFDWIK